MVSVSFFVVVFLFSRVRGAVLRFGFTGGFRFRGRMDRFRVFYLDYRGVVMFWLCRER